MKDEIMRVTACRNRVLGESWADTVEDAQTPEQAVAALLGQEGHKDYNS